MSFTLSEYEMKVVAAALDALDCIAGLTNEEMNLLLELEDYLLFYGKLNY